jgi:hypothetical protein
MDRKKIVLYILIIFVVLVFCLWFFVIRDKKINKVVPVISLQELEYNIDISNKEIKISLGNNELQNNLLAISKNWQYFYDNFKDNQPEKYRRTKDFSKKIWEINTISAKAYELSLEGKEAEAKAETAKAREKYLQIKKENNILDISNELYNFYAQAILISEAKNKIEIMELLPELKIQFAGIKERKKDGDYLSAIKLIEELMVKLNRQMDGPELQLAQKDIIILAKELYLNN